MSGGQDEIYEQDLIRQEHIRYVFRQFDMECRTFSEVPQEQENRIWALAEMKRHNGEIDKAFTSFVLWLYRNASPGVNTRTHECCSWAINKIHKIAKCSPLDLIR